MVKHETHTDLFLSLWLLNKLQVEMRRYLAKDMFYQLDIWEKVYSRNLNLRGWKNKECVEINATATFYTQSNSNNKLLPVPRNLSPKKPNPCCAFCKWLYKIWKLPLAYENWKTRQIVRSSLRMTSDHRLPDHIKLQNLQKKSHHTSLCNIRDKELLIGQEVLHKKQRLKFQKH